ncbi:MAG: PepSY domain-containing protein [Bacteroidetes bacterium]|nr:PepSY domain-containing protein [Bacteroidota bacterium]
MVWVFFSQFLTHLQKRRINSALIPVALLILAGCAGTQSANEPAAPGAVTPEPVHYPAPVEYSADQMTGFRTDLTAFFAQTGARYEKTEIDSLLFTVRHLQYGNPHLNLMAGKSAGSEGFTSDELDAALRLLFSRWSRLFNTDGRDLKIQSTEETGEYVQITYRKQFPQDYPFANPEFNLIEVIISRQGELGYLSSTAVPDLPMPRITWNDPEKSRRELYQYKFSYEKNGRNQVYVIQDLGVVSGGKQSALVLVRRKKGNSDLELRPDNISLTYHYTWEFLITPEEGKPALFKVYVDALTGEILESYNLGS